jgi:hypothetical protein
VGPNLLKVNEAINFFIADAPHPVKNKLALFAGFQEGWNLGEGKQFSESVLDTTLSLIQECLYSNLFDLDLFPGLDGDIRLTIYKTPNYHEFTVEDSLKVTYYHERSDFEEEYQTDLTDDEARHKINQIGKIEWISLEYSTPSGLIRPATDSTVSHSNLEDNRYLCLRSSAP